MITLIFCCGQAVAHGGVGMEGDKCIINIGFLKAHFSGYQLSNKSSVEFCEDAPQVAHSIFVVEYLHDFLKEMQVDFRIVKDINDVTSKIDTAKEYEIPLFTPDDFSKKYL